MLKSFNTLNKDTTKADKVTRNALTEIAIERKGATETYRQRYRDGDRESEYDRLRIERKNKAK